MVEQNSVDLKGEVSKEQLLAFVKEEQSSRKRAEKKIKKLEERFVALAKEKKKATADLTVMTKLVSANEASITELEQEIEVVERVFTMMFGKDFRDDHGNIVFDRLKSMWIQIKKQPVATVPDARDDF